MPDYHDHIPYSQGDSPLNMALVVVSALAGRHAIMQTIMMGKMEMDVPDMYMTNMFMGNDLSGARAISHARFVSKCRWSVEPATSTAAWQTSVEACE